MEFKIPDKLPERLKSLPRKPVYIVFLILNIGILAGSLVLRHFIGSIPPVQSLEEYLPRLTTRLYDYKGAVISEFFTERRTWVPLNQIPIDLQNAFIAVEDDKFFKHWGISPQGMVRAAVRNFLAGRVVQGGSTITQQLSKLIFLTQEKTLGRKIRELLLSLQIEHRFSKQEILQMYLNQVYFGHGAYGVSAAARIFYGKPVQELSLAECALLAGLPRLPSYYSPFNHPETAENRRAIVLRRLRELKYISLEEERLAKATPLGVSKTPMAPSVASYFVENIRRSLEEKYGSELLYRGGLSIHTTLDLDMQMAAERIMSDAGARFDKEYGAAAEALRAKEKSLARKKAGEKKWEVKASTNPPKVQMSLVAIDPKSGEIRALVGGRDFNESQFNRATQAKRQPGSTFKPFVWMAALDGGFTAASIVNDNPIAFVHDGRDWKLLEGATNAYQILEATATLAEDKAWVPKNYDGKFFGPVTLRRAFAYSRNIVSVRLMDNLGPPKVVEWAQKLGVLSPLDPVLSLGLGTSVVTLLELTSAIGTLAADGIRTVPYSVVKVTDFEGKVLEQNFPQESEVVNPQLNALTVNLLRAVVQEGTGHAAAALDRPAGGKTGTSQDQRDLWFVGFTPDLVCGAWMGYDDFAALGKKMSSGGILVPWWTEFMKAAHKDLPVRDFTVPSGITFSKIDKTTGFLALPSCPKIILEMFKSGTEPKEFCPVDHYDKSSVEMETEE